MKTSLVWIFSLFSYLSFAQTIWTGPTITFTKADGADFTQAVNQDRITSDVWITRQNQQGIFNIFLENTYRRNFSPADTEWAFGTTADLSTLTFDNWQTTHGGDPTSTVDQDMVLHLITDDIYIDIKFLSWSVGRQGGNGGFSYERSTDQTASTNDAVEQKMTVTPIPATEQIRIGNIDGEVSFQVFDLKGSTALNGFLHSDQSIDISGLLAGVYFLKVDGRAPLKFVKTD